MVKTAGCGSVMRGFESHYPPQKVMGYRQAVRQRILIPSCAGSNPATLAKEKRRSTGVFFRTIRQDENRRFGSVFDYPKVPPALMITLVFMYNQALFFTIQTDSCTGTNDMLLYKQKLPAPCVCGQIDLYALNTPVSIQNCFCT